MNAKEMFEKLGYKINEQRDYIEFTEKNLRLAQVIIFNKKYIMCETWCPDGYVCISPEIHKAIHQQIKELGWIE